MSKTTVSASATALPSRRLLLAACPAATALMALPAVAANDPSLLLALVERGKAAATAYNELCEKPEFDLHDSNPLKAEFNAELSRLHEEEWDVVAEICAYPARSMEEARIKAAYIAKHCEWFQLEEHLIKAYIHSFMI